MTSPIDRAIKDQYPFFDRERLQRVFDIESVDPAKWVADHIPDLLEAVTSNYRNEVIEKLKVIAKKNNPNATHGPIHDLIKELSE